MKIPQKSPSLENLFKHLQQSKHPLIELISAKYTDNNYYSYEDLKYRPLPDFAKTKEEWWLKILLCRQGKFRTSPLKDLSGNPFLFFVDDSDWELLHNIDFKGGGIIETGTSLPQNQENTRYLISSLMEEAIASSLLEGAPTTREKAKEMLRQNRLPQNEGERMVLNNFKTMQKLKEWKNEPLSPTLLFQIHESISEGTLPKEKIGRFRLTKENIVVGNDYGEDFHIPPPAEQLKQRIQKLCDFANSENNVFLHPVIQAIILHFWLAYEHPFCDGNGRVARALFYWFLLKNNYWICEYISISTIIKQSGLRYYKAFLDTEYNGNDLNYFIKFHLEILKRSTEEFLKYVAKKQAERKAASEQFYALELVNSRQRILLESWLKNPHLSRALNVEAYQNEHHVSRETARQDLFDLKKKGWAIRKRDGRAFIFVAPQNLETLLKTFNKI